MRLLLIINLLTLILLRILIKYNRSIKVLGLISILLQTFLIFSLPLRDRTTSFTVPFEIFIFFFVVISLIPLLLPVLVNLVLTKNYRNKIEKLEEKLNHFMYDLIFQIQKFFYQFSYYQKIESFLSRWLTKLVLKLLVEKETFFLIFLGTPWYLFIISFYIDLHNRFFFLSIYLVSYFLIAGRIVSVLLFFVKNSLWTLFYQDLFGYNKELYYNLINFVDLLFLDRTFLINLIFKPDDAVTLSKKTDIIFFWKKLNKWLYFFLYFSIVKIYWVHFLPKFRLALFLLNFFAISIGVVFHYSFAYRWLYLVVAVIFLIVFFINLFNKKSANLTSLIIFLEELDLFINKFKEKLIIEKGFSKLEASTGLTQAFPKFPKPLPFMKFAKVFLLGNFILVFGISLSDTSYEEIFDMFEIMSWLLWFYHGFMSIKIKAKILYLLALVL